MTAEMILGGRWLKQDSKGPMGASLGMIGFDRRHGDFVVVGFDESSTYSVTGRGKRDEQTGTVVMHGEDDDLMGKQVYRFEWDVKSEDEQSVKIIFTELGPMKFEGGFEMIRMDLKRRE
ncbi:MAG: DUF1579 family protein [Planctomycetota bacterium JB042]